MQLRYDEDFIEAAVFLCARGKHKRAPSLQIARFHREREKLYSIPDPDDRNTAFFKLHLDWFREWDLEKALVELLKEFPLLMNKADALVVRKTRGKNDEGAELYVNDAGQRSAILALRPESFECDKALRDYVRHEFTHLHDMLDPAFGYSPSLQLPGLNGAQQRLARERYRLLWDITIDGRLAAANHTPAQSRERHAAAFDRGYSFWPEPRRVETFDSLWRGPSPRHTDLLALIADPRGLRDAHRPAPGASCPLCEFPTFNWADATALSADIQRRITAEFPAWTQEQGLCGRCLETYEAVRNLSPIAEATRVATKLRVEHLFISPGHNFFGHHGQPAGKNPLVPAHQIECVTGRGIRGDRFFDFKENYKGQITFFAMEVFDALCRELNLPQAQPQDTRRNVFVRGADLSALVGQEFEVQGVRFAGVEESKPCYWMDSALGPGAEQWLRGRGGLRCRILSDGILHCEN